MNESGWARVSTSTVRSSMNRRNSDRSMPAEMIQTTTPFSTKIALAYGLGSADGVRGLAPSVIHAR
jgi:L-aminopeptidase/D-esterase-like protein